MANVQVHCEHCDKSLYRLGYFDDAVGVTGKPTGIVELWHDFRPDYDPRLPSPRQMTFCHWKCVEKWAQSKRPVEDRAQEALEFTLEIATAIEPDFEKRQVLWDKIQERLTEEIPSVEVSA